MSSRPVLVMQVRRMGDLVLAFPLLRELHARYPDSPVWMVGQPVFYEPLKQFASNVQFFPHQALPALSRESYEAVINLGGPEIVAEYAGKMKADQKLGLTSQNGQLHISGFWHLYRESLTCNNIHNGFHWADLFRLDTCTLPFENPLASRPAGTSSNAIGVFIGASEPLKHPDAVFWSRLCRQLDQLGYQVVLLGGPNEAPLGAEIMKRKVRALNLSGKTTLGQLGAILQNLELLITPDTGPMHLADLLGVRVLNLSMGNVQAVETGPVSPDQFVLRSTLSCRGCWECAQAQPICKKAFAPNQVARTIDWIIKGGNNYRAHPSLELLVTGRDQHGLHILTGERKTAQTWLTEFWKKTFLAFAGIAPEASALEPIQIIREKYPGVVQSMKKALLKMRKAIRQAPQKGLPPDFWSSFPAHTRLFAGNLQMTLQNDGQTEKSAQKLLGRMELVNSVLNG